MLPFLTSVVAVVISVALSGIVAWWLDTRKERRSSRKYDADREAVIDFLRKLPSMRESINSIIYRNPANDPFGDELNAARNQIDQVFKKYIE